MVHLPRPQLLAIADKFSILQIIFNLCTTVICTVLITIRILRLGGARTRFWRSLEVMIESALIYVIVLVVGISFAFTKDPVKGIRISIIEGCLPPVTVTHLHFFSVVLGLRLCLRRVLPQPSLFSE
jgi:hypothetical protein